MGVSAVPHHLVDAKLYKRAREKADSKGVSISKIAVAGLEKYVEDADRWSLRTGAELAEGDLYGFRSYDLPGDTAKTLKKMRATNDPMLSIYLEALRRKGWSLGVLAEAVGISRQGVHSRIKTLSEAPIPRDIPPVPSSGQAPWKAPKKAPGGERVDMPIWVPRELYSMASTWARKKGDRMTSVMEQILSDFVQGRLSVK